MDSDSERQPHVEEQSTEEETETETLIPDMYFQPKEYKKQIKISSRCLIKEAVELITNTLRDSEIRWFENHPQFKHFFHKSTPRTHKVQGMWMLLLRTARTEKLRVAWFVVNGVPVRYSIREHGLISGLYCHNYPRNWRRLGGKDFVDRNFERGATITYESVRHKLQSMRYGRDRLNMAVLYFLSSVIAGKTKKGKGPDGEGAPSVDEFFLRAANDLELCRTFPWGRYSFYDNLAHMKNLLDKFNGVVEKDSWCFPSFSIPLQLLAFEVIPDLRTRFVDDVVDADPRCRRMCKLKFKNSGLTGFPLSEVNEALGTTKDITSLVKPYIGEAPLMQEIFDPVEDIPDEHDYIVETWRRRLLDEGRPVLFESMFNEDVEARGAGEHEIPPVPPTLAAELVELRKSMEDGFTNILDMLAQQDERLKAVESFVQSQRSGAGGDEDDDVSYHGNVGDDVGGNVYDDVAAAAVGDDADAGHGGDDAAAAAAVGDDAAAAVVSGAGGDEDDDDDGVSYHGNVGGDEDDDDDGVSYHGNVGDDVAAAAVGDDADAGRGGDDDAAAAVGDDAAAVVSGGGGDDGGVSGQEEEAVEKRLKRPAAACKSPYMVYERKKKKNA